MKYQISESQYKKLVLKYLNNIIKDIIFEDDEYDGDNWVDVFTSDGLDIGSVWFKTIENRGTITQGCNTELSLDEDFTQEFEQTIPIIMPKVFSEVVLEYFNSKTELECDCLEVPYRNGDKVYRYDSKEQ